MAIRTINIGQAANDGAGDDLRTAFQKVNENFATLGANVTQGANVGVYGSEVFLDIVPNETGSTIRFRKLYPDDTLTLTAGPEEINFTVNPINVVTDNGRFNLLTGTTLTVAGSKFISTKTQVDGTVVIEPTPLTENFDINGFNIIDTQNGQGITAKIYGLDVRAIDSTLNSFDFGTLFAEENYSSPVSMISSAFVIDMGTFTNPTIMGIEAGSII